jgi:hypothetical protein
MDNIVKRAVLTRTIKASDYAELLGLSDPPAGVEFYVWSQFQALNNSGHLLVKGGK